MCMTWTREQWRTRTDWNTVCARAAARKKWNEERRRFAGQRRDEEVWPLLLRYGIFEWGTLSRIARELGCHRSTILRDKQALLRSLV
jgi:DNA invertase Pin-like site-specific DNA recombinase